MAMQAQTVYKWILYVNPEVHVNEYKIVKNAQLENYILIQDVRQAKVLPTWLSVLPCLVNTKTRKAFRGSTCMKNLVNVDLPIEHQKRLHRKQKNRFEESL